MEVEGFLFLYWPPSFVLTAFLLILLNRKEFKYSFYRILQCDMIVNILNQITAEQYRLCFWSFTAPFMLVIYEKFYVIFAICAFGVNFFYNIQATNVICMSIHRMLSSKFIKTDELWKKFFFPIYIPIIVLYIILRYYMAITEMISPQHYVYETESFLATVPPKMSANISG